MKIKKSSTRKKFALAAVPAVLVLALAGYLGYTYLLPSEQASPDQSQAADEPPQDIDNATPAEPSINEDTTDTTSPEMTKPPREPKSTESTTDGSLLPPTILSARQTDDKHIRVSANFTEAANGDCRLTLTKAGEPSITKKVKIIVVPNGYACNGFKVAVPSSDGWTAHVTHLHNGKESKTSSMKVE